MQSKRHSLIESITNIVIGYIVAIIGTILIFPVFNIHISMTENLAISGCFTVLSIIRSYALRRWFNKKTITQVKHDEIAALNKKIKTYEGHLIRNFYEMHIDYQNDEYNCSCYDRDPCPYHSLSELLINENIKLFPYQYGFNSDYKKEIKQC